MATVQHLVKRYGHLVAVNDVSLSIHEGEIFGIIGPNGAGKTTTVECISGLVWWSLLGPRGRFRDILPFGGETKR